MRTAWMSTAVVAIIAITGGCAIAETKAPAAIAQTAKGDTLVDAHGMTLYVFDKDAAGKSVCNGPCAGNWPPLVAEAGAGGSGDYSLVIRDDGSQQWAYKGRPLYTWKKDQKPGDITGDGFLENAWHVAQP